MNECAAPCTRLFTRKYLIRVAVVDLAAAVAAVLLSIWFHKITTSRELAVSSIDALIYAYVIGSIGAFILPPISVLASKRGPAVLIASVGAGIVFMTIAGCAIAGAIQVAVGLATKENAIANFVPTVRFSIVIALVAGLGAFYFEATRSRLEETKLALREGQLAEERALKLAAEAQLSSLESRVHPHFLFNTLNSIAALIHDEPNRAEEIVGRLAALLRFSLDANQRRLVALEDELKIVRDYLEIEKARFGERLRYSIATPDGAEGLLVPAMSVQSLVENSVKHAIAPRREGGEIRVGARNGGGQIVIEVSDDGPGFDLAAAPEGHGIDNLRARLEAIYTGRASLEQSGSAVRIILPEQKG